MGQRFNVPIIASTVKHDSITCAGQQTLSNLFYHPIEDHTGTRNSGILKGTPGFSLWKDLSGSLIRGMIVPGDGLLYVVRDSTVYKVTTSGTETSLGTLTTSTGRVSMAASQTEVVICDEVKIWKIVLATTTLSDISTTLTALDPTFVPKFVFAQNSRFYYYVGKSNKVYISNTLDAATVQSTANIQISINYGTLQWATSSAWYQYYMADNTTEIWVDQGATGVVPIIRPDGMSIPIGIMAKYSSQVIGDTLFMLAKDANGLLGVVAVKGNQYTVISDYSFLARLKEFYSITDAYAYQDNWEGHPIYCITFPNAEFTAGFDTNLGYTICYDTVTQLWSEHPSYNEDSLRQDCHEAFCSAYFNNLNLIGSYKSGKLYSESPLTYSENSQTIIRKLVTPQVLFKGNRGSISHLELHVESNEGLLSGQGSEPIVMMRVSKDYGNTWGIETHRTVSVQGQFNQRARWSTIGSSRVFTFEFTMSDPIRWVIPALTAEVSVNQ